MIPGRDGKGLRGISGRSGLNASSEVHVLENTIPSVGGGAWRGLQAVLMAGLMLLLQEGVSFWVSGFGLKASGSHLCSFAPSVTLLPSPMAWHSTKTLTGWWDLRVGLSSLETYETNFIWTHYKLPNLWYCVIATQNRLTSWYCQEVQLIAICLGCKAHVSTWPLSSVWHGFWGFFLWFLEGGCLDSGFAGVGVGEATIFWLE